MHAGGVVSYEIHYNFALLHNFTKIKEIFYFVLFLLFTDLCKILQMVSILLVDRNKRWIRLPSNDRSIPRKSPANEPAPMTSSMSGRVKAGSSCANLVRENARPVAPPGRVKGPRPARYAAIDTGWAAAIWWNGNLILMCT